MQMVLRLEEKEKTAICTILDMFRQMDKEGMTDIVDDGADLIGVISDDVTAYLEYLYNTYA